MNAWLKMGKWLGAHMMFIAPLCVLCGVMWPEVFSTYKPLVPFLFAVMTFQGSLNNNVKSVLEVFRHPRYMLAILAVTAVVMPALARLLAGVLFAGNPELVVGITLEYCVPVAVVCFMWTGMYEGNLSLALATILTSTVLAPFTIPLTLKVLLGETVQVDVLSMMRDMVIMIAVPALLGMVVNETTHGWGHQKLSPALSPAARTLLMFIIASNSTAMSPYMRNLTPELVGAMVFILAFATFGFCLGAGAAKLLRVNTPTFVTICFAVGLRNISAGSVLAAQFFPGAAIVPVMMGTLFQQVLAGVFGGAMEKMLAGRKG